MLFSQNLFQSEQSVNGSYGVLLLSPLLLVQQTPHGRFKECVAFTVTDDPVEPPSQRARVANSLVESTFGLSF